MLQVLANLPSFRYTVESLEDLDFCQFSAINFLKSVFRSMHEGHQVIKPVSIVKNISYVNARFVPCRFGSPDKQHDALTFLRSLVKVAGDEERTRFNTRKIADLFAGEDKRRLSCPKCSHVQVVYQSFVDVGVAVAVEKNLLKSKALRYNKCTIDGYPCQMCENKIGVTQEISLNRGSNP